MDYQEKKNLYKIRTTVLEMLTDRKYPIPENFNIGFEDFLLLLEENNLDLFIIKDQVDSIYVRFMYDYNKNITKKDLDNTINEIKTQTEDPNIKIILVLRSSSMPSKDLVDKDQIVELFSQDNLVFNPTKHYLVPNHILLSEEEVKVILKTRKCNKNQLPKLPRTDPIAKYYGARSGDVFKIIRRTPAMGHHIYYRHVK